mmetsp:Transcript_18747/g.30933  ORF Transcript_18747/g.30933 Transcript_18747/m.30933 type:complete len:342 (-) Transcript_18747:283-1308(-)
MSSVPSSCFTALVGGALGERTEPWETLMSVISDTDSWKSDTKRAEDAGVDEGGTPHVATKKPPSETKKLLNVTMADNQALKKLALHALHRIERTRDIVWGPENLASSASCFNWALCAGDLGYDDDFSSWPPALFDWISVAERSKHPWRSEGKPWKTVSYIAVQRRCAKVLKSFGPQVAKEIDAITARHLKRVGKLKKEDWERKGKDLELLVAEDVMRLAVKMAGMVPITNDTQAGDYSASSSSSSPSSSSTPSPSSIVVGMRGKPGVACNFSHWWLEVPTGRMYSNGRPERVRCETYPNAPIYFTPCYFGAPGAKTPRGTFRVQVKELLPRHLELIRSALK